MTMYDSRTRLAQQVVEEVRDFFEDKVFKTLIPRTVRLSEAPSFGQPVMLYDPTGKGADGIPGPGEGSDGSCLRGGSAAAFRRSFRARRRSRRHGEEVTELAVDMIAPNPEQPRTDIDEEGIAELADSITKVGLLQPIIVRAHR